MHMNYKSLLRFFGSSADAVPPLRNVPAPQTATTTTTLTDAQMLGEILDAQTSSAARTFTTRTATQLEAAFAGRLNVGDSWDLFIINSSTTSADTVVLAMGTGVTLVGNNDIEEEDAITNSSSAHFRFRKTGANAFSCYRLA
jgi:predicted amidohydrolase|tara:strand:+ start:103 stop:528 length:426 start_codon:yes stop_codon:yes gene_type:complete